MYLRIFLNRTRGQFPELKFFGLVMIFKHFPYLLDIQRDSMGLQRFTPVFEGSQ